MNQRIRELMVEAGYAAPEIAKRAQELSDSIIKDCIQTLVNNGYTDAAQCLNDVHFGLQE